MTSVAGPWLAAETTQAVMAALRAGGATALFVGGCVRNALIGAPVADVDIATDARPDEVVALAEAAGLRAVPTGIAHGTITLVARGHPYEVTTFRRDVETFGRHATVAFSDDVAEDAARRDFTMNALYADAGGRVIDPLGGLPDLRARRVRFVGAPAARIAEDYLRILRFFRFHAWYGDAAAGPDPAGLAACAAARDGIDRLSRERVGAEMARLLAAPDPAPALAAMAAAGVLARVLPGADAGPLAALVRLEQAAGLAPRWQRRLAALGGTGEMGAEAWAGALRLSRADAKALTATRLAAGLPAAAAAWRHGPEAARDATLIAAARAGEPTAPASLEADIARGGAAALPVRAADLPLSGADLGRALGAMEEAWLASDLSLDAAALRAAAGV